MKAAKGLAFVVAWMLVTSRAFAEEKDATTPNKVFRAALSLDRVLFIGPFLQNDPRGEWGISAAAASYVRSTDVESSGEPFVPHAIARLGADIALPWNLTAGIAGGHGVVVATPKNGGYVDEPMDRSVAMSVLQTRFGYVHPLKGTTLFWFRTGFAYTFASDDISDGVYSENRRRTSIRHFSVPIDFVFVFRPAKHFGITYGISADLGLYGVDIRETSGSDIPTEKSEGRRVNDGVGMWLGLTGLL